MSESHTPVFYYAEKRKSYFWIESDFWIRKGWILLKVQIYAFFTITNLKWRQVDFCLLFAGLLAQQFKCQRQKMTIFKLRK